MYLRSLILTQFKNHATAKHEFSAHLNLIIGANGSGKTNLLDAIYLLCNTKSAFLSSDALAIQHEQDFFRLEGHFASEGRDIRIECTYQKEAGKTFLAEGKAPDRLSAYIGRFPVVLTSPYDTDLIREGSDVRRKFFDQVLSQSKPDYLDKLMAYNRLLKQRNALLKQFAESGRLNLSLLSVYDEQLLPLNAFISTERAELLTVFLPFVTQAYEELADKAELPHIAYKSQALHPDFETQFGEHRRLDLANQRTHLGIHTDDYELTFNQQPLKRYGSQGQQKTFVLALKLAHFHYVLQLKKAKPILLLDDIFDRLDETRIKKLTQQILDKKFGQVFITDASPKRVQEIFGVHSEIYVIRTN